MDGEKRRGEACVCGRHTWLERHRDRYEICVLYELEFNFLNTLDVDSK